MEHVVIFSILVFSAFTVGLPVDKELISSDDEGNSENNVGPEKSIESAEENQDEKVDPQVIKNSEIEATTIPNQKKDLSQKMVVKDNRQNSPKVSNASNNSSAVTNATFSRIEKNSSITIVHIECVKTDEHGNDIKQNCTEGQLLKINSDSPNTTEKQDKTTKGKECYKNIDTKSLTTTEKVKVKNDKNAQHVKKKDDDENLKNPTTAKTTPSPILDILGDLINRTENRNKILRNTSDMKEDYSNSNTGDSPDSDTTYKCNNINGEEQEVVSGPTFELRIPVNIEIRDETNDNEDPRLWKFPRLDVISPLQQSPIVEADEDYSQQTDLPAHDDEDRWPVNSLPNYDQEDPRLWKFPRLDVISPPQQSPLVDGDEDYSQQTDLPAYDDEDRWPVNSMPNYDQEDPRLWKFPRLDVISPPQQSPLVDGDEDYSQQTDLPAYDDEDRWPVNSLPDYEEDYFSDRELQPNYNDGINQKGCNSHKHDNFSYSNNINMPPKYLGHFSKLM